MLMVHVVSLIIISLYIYFGIRFLIFNQPNSFKAQRIFYFCFFIHAIFVLIVLYQFSNNLEVINAIYALLMSLILSSILLFLIKKFKFGLFASLISFLTASLLSLSSYLFHFKQTQLDASFNKIIFSFHVIPALISEAFLILTGITALVYLIQEHRLRKKVNLKNFFKGPNLEFIDRAIQIFILIGFTFMCFSFLSVLVFYPGTILKLDYRALLAVVTLLFFAMLLVLRKKLLISKKLVALVTFFGTTIIVVSTTLIVLINKNIAHTYYIQN